MKRRFSAIVGFLSISSLVIMALIVSGRIDERARAIVIPMVGILIFHEGFIRYEKNRMIGIALMLVSALGFVILVARYLEMIGWIGG